MAMLMLMRTQRHQRRRRRRTTQRHVHCDAERKYAARMKDERCDGSKLELGSGGKPVLNGRSSGSGSSSSSSRRRRKTECDVRVRSSVGVDPTPVSSSHADEQGGEDTLVAFEVGREEKDDEVEETPGARAERLNDEFSLRNYAKPSGVVLTRGEGVRVYDTLGREYLDFTSGIAVNALGHSHPKWVEAVQTQCARLTHVSNLFHTEQGPELMQRLSHSIGGLGGKVFLCNSGTEANEAAIKFARKYSAACDAEQTGPLASIRRLLARGIGAGRHGREIVSFTGGFHGRTMGALSLTSNPKYREPFAPNLPGARFAEYNNLESARRAIRRGRTCAVFVEPVQGEGGVVPGDVDFIRGLRELCDDAGALLVFDEVQCGLGRTGWLYAHEKYGVNPDIITLAKPLAGGLPIGATIIADKVANTINPGDHGSTFAGGPVVCAAALTVLDILEEPGFLEHVEAMSKLLRELVVDGSIGAHPDFVEFRSAGLLIGVQMRSPVARLVDAARSKGLLVCSAGKGDVIRLVPPLIVGESDVREAVRILEEVLLREHE